MSRGFVRAHNLPESAALPPDPALAAQNISVLACCPGLPGRADADEGVCLLGGGIRGRLCRHQPGQRWIRSSTLCPPGTRRVSETSCITVSAWTARLGDL